MAEAIVPYAMAVIGGLLGLLCTVLGWVGVQLKGEIRTLAKELKIELTATNVTLSKIERDLRGELTNLDRRVTRVEERCLSSDHGRFSPHLAGD